MRNTEESKFGDFPAADVFSALEKGRKIFEGFEFRTFLTHKDEPEDHWCAVSLEMNVVSTGANMKEAIMNLIALMAFHVEEYIENGIEKDIFMPAPPELWLSFAQSPKERKPDLPRRFRNNRIVIH
jgi:hypothetical protein